MRLTLPLLCCATFGAAFVPRGGIVTNVTPSASRCGLPGGRHASRCLVPGESSWRASSGFGLDWAISHEVRVHGDGDGSGSISPATPPPSAIAATEAKIEAVEKEIEAVEKKIEAVEAALSGGPAYLGVTDGNFLLKQLQQLQEEKKQLREEKKQLREEKMQLREKEKQLREEKLVLLKKPAAAAVSLSAGENVADFAAALTKATVTNNTLELANDTLFFGKRALGSKLFIRPCYKELSEIILDGASKGALENIVVTGTPGIGKSVFGFYLLYLLRCQGRTVVCERKGAWYRFSDEGAQEGRYESFYDAGYFTEDPTAWYLSDPENRPKEVFDGTTVVLVSPKGIRVHEFLKQGKSKRFYMSVWSLNELLECQQAVFPDVRSTDVERDFGVVGGVARAIFDANQLEVRKTKMMSAAKSVSLDLLRDVVYSNDRSSFGTDSIGDTLFHIFQGGTNDFVGCVVSVASEHAAELIHQELTEKGRRDFGYFVQVVMGDRKLREAVGASLLGKMFENFAHLSIRGELTAVAPKYKVIFLTGGDEDEMGENFLTGGDGEDVLSLNFTGWGSFKGNTFPQTFAMSTYYEPESPNFASIDSFGVDERSSTLFFFQMKSAHVKAVIGNFVEGYWNKAVSNVASIKRCVFVYVVPAGEVWERATELRERGDWLTEASDEFKSACSVCVIEMPVRIGDDMRG